MTEDELEKIKTEKDKSIQILLFTDVENINPIYYEKSYYDVPDGSDKAFELLRVAMLQSHKIAVAKTVLGTKETLIALVASQNGILASTLFFANEIKPMPKAYMQANLEESEITMAKTLIDSMTKPFEAEKYHDECGE